jgi:hypothetical protein
MASIATWYGIHHILVFQSAMTLTLLIVAAACALALDLQVYAKAPNRGARSYTDVDERAINCARQGAFLLDIPR